MVIAIDISPLENEHSLRGTGSYTNNLSRALGKYKTSIEIILFTRKQKLPKKVDLVHYTYFDPFLLTLPFLQAVPFIVTVHDLIPLWYPQHFPRGIRGEVKWLVQKHNLMGASAIVTDSKYSQKRIHQTLGYPLENIWAIPLAASEVYGLSPSVELIQKVRKQYTIPEKYILYVGDVNWNKNIIGLIHAFKRVLENEKDLRLLLVGGSLLYDALSEVKEINTMLYALRLEKRVIKTGYVPDEELAVLYSQAAAYVQPSFAEGFGLPVLEAMACGCLTVVSRETSLPEIAGPSVVVNPYDYESIAQGILAAMRTDRIKGSEEAKRWAKTFSWKIVAQKTIDVYRKVLEEN